MARKNTRALVEEFLPPQDWTALLPGQQVEVRLLGGQRFEAFVETKTSSSQALWIIRADSLQTRQVFSHTDGVQLVPITRTSDPQSQIAAPFVAGSLDS